MLAKFGIFSENEWLYPDTEIKEQGEAKLYAARGSDVCFQVLTDIKLNGDEILNVTSSGLEGEVVVYQLFPAHVGRNSAANFETTDNYEDVKDFVTRKAPFDVYDVTLLPEDNKLVSGRAGFFIRINVAQNAKVGEYNGNIKLEIGNEEIIVPVYLKIFNTVVPCLNDSEFHSVNWIYYDKIPAQHNVEQWSERYFEILGNYIDNQLDLRSDVLMIPRGEPIRDENGKVIDFDFTSAEQVGNLALKKGMRYIMGGFCVEWEAWNKPELYLLWDKVDVTTIEAYRQLKLYFTGVKKCIERNNWQNKYMQCLVDEPQFRTAPSYRALGAICRKFLPDVMINDPVETPEIAGALDIWVVKQAIYEKYIEEFRTLQDCGEKLWIYSCGYPAGKMMNHVMDLPISASRLIIYMCYKYNTPGFLHFGYHLHNEETWGEACYRASRGRKFPGGNSFIVYPVNNGPQYSVRGHAQRCGIYDYELLKILGEKSPEKAEEILDLVCRDFSDYETDANKLDDARRQLLERLG